MCAFILHELKSSSGAGHDAVDACGSCPRALDAALPICACATLFIISHFRHVLRVGSVLIPPRQERMLEPVCAVGTLNMYFRLIA